VKRCSSGIRTGVLMDARVTPAEVVLRMLLLKHTRNWSFAELQQEVRANLVYRQFTRIRVEKVPDAKTLRRLAHACGPLRLSGASVISIHAISGFLRVFMRSPRYALCLNLKLCARVWCLRSLSTIGSLILFPYAPRPIIEEGKDIVDWVIGCGSGSLYLLDPVLDLALAETVLVFPGPLGGAG
jgi:hypothetical protein